MDENKKDPVRSSTDSSTKFHVLKSQVSARDIVQTLTPFLRIETEEKDGVKKEFVIRKCPKGEYCKNGKKGEIRYQNKTGYKNPCSHLRSCLAKVRCVRCFDSFLIIEPVKTFS